MQTSLIGQLQSAHQAISRGELDTAERILQGLVSIPATSLDAIHALAVLNKKRGHLQEAAAGFEQVLASRPGDAQVHNNFANCLRDLGRLEAAVVHYRQALELKPDYIDAMLNYGMLLKSRGEYPTALGVLNKAIAVQPEDARLWHGLATLRREMGALDEAVKAIEKALELQPGSVRLLGLRARLEAELGRGAFKYYQRALEVAPEDPELKLGAAVALFETGDGSQAVEALKELTCQCPEYVEGQVALAQLCWQLGDREGYLTRFAETVRAYPVNRELVIAYFSTLMRSARYDLALQELDYLRPRFDDQYLLDRYEAACASEAGDLARARYQFERLLGPDDAQLQLAYLRFLLREGDFPGTARLAEQMTSTGGNLAAWPYLSIAWRLLNDPRSTWLDGDPNLVQVLDFPEFNSRLPELTQVLRSCHYAAQHPFDQSMRGGSQTDGNLMLRHEPVLQELRQLIEAGVRTYIEQLPQIDPAHPFLRYQRDWFHIDASYSVRLNSNGFHINHVHPEAAISCCFYVHTPDSIGDEQAKADGWLTIGQPPVELGIDLAAIQRVRPQPARLALFPSIMWHGTLPFPKGERLTVVSDLSMRSVSSGV